MAGAPFNIAGVLEDFGVVRQRSLCDGQFAESSAIVEKAIVIINRQSEVRLARVGLKMQCVLHGGIGQIETVRAAVKPIPIDSAMNSGEQAPAKQELRITSHRFIQEVRSLRELLPGVQWI